MRTVVNRQVQRVHTRTALRIVVRIRINSCFRVGYTMPRVTFAGSLSHHIVCSMFDSQMQSVHRWTTASQSVIKGIITRLSVCFAVPCVLIARLNGKGLSRRIAQPRHRYIASHRCSTAIVPDRPNRVVVVAIVCHLIAIGSGVRLPDIGFIPVNLIVCQ